MMGDDDHNIWLSPEEYDAFIEELTNPPEPTEKLRELMSGVTDEMIEAGKAQFVAALIEGYPDNAGDGRVFARAYMAMKALDPTLSQRPTRKREEADALLPFFASDWGPLRRVADQVGKSASQIASLARDLGTRGLIESRWVGHYSIKEYRRKEDAA